MFPGNRLGIDQGIKSPFSRLINRAGWCILQPTQNLKMNRRNFLRGLGGGALLITTGSFMAEFLPGLPAATVDNPPMGKVRIIGPDGKLTAPIEMPKVVKTDAEWHKQLTAQQYSITRDKDTEPAFCGVFYDNHKEGIYHCVCCN